VTVHYTREGPVAWLTIDRPEARNALSAEVRAGLWDGVRRFVADDAAVLVLTGAGDRAFCAGGDLKEMADTGLEVPPPDFLPLFRPQRRRAQADDRRRQRRGVRGRVPAGAAVRPGGGRRARHAPCTCRRPAAEADEIWAPVYRSADAQEGPRAFREKRTPVWKGC